MILVAGEKGTNPWVEMASHTRFPGVKTPNGVYGAQYQHPPHLMQNPTGVVPNVMQASAMAPPSMTTTSIYGVQPGHQVSRLLFVIRSFFSGGEDSYDN